MVGVETTTASGDVAVIISAAFVKSATPGASAFAMSARRGGAPQ
jgi:hypothetical protein